MYKEAPGGVIRLTDGAFIPHNDMPDSPWAAVMAWVAAGNQISPALSLVDAKEAARRRVTAYAMSKRSELVPSADPFEISSWANKTRIALAIGAGTASAQDLAAFTTEIALRGVGETMEAFCGKVIAKADFYAKGIGMIDGIKRKSFDAIAAADSPEAIEALLAQMKQIAEAAYAEMMQAAPAGD